MRRGRSYRRRATSRGPQRHSDDFFNCEEPKIEHGYFHSLGVSEIVVPPGAVKVEVSRGLEYRRVEQTVEVTEGGLRDVKVALERLADWPARGWWSGDLHVHMHMNYGAPIGRPLRRCGHRRRPMTCRSCSS
jgi:hypothetical protein